MSELLTAEGPEKSLWAECPILNVGHAHLGSSVTGVSPISTGTQICSHHSAVNKSWFYLIRFVLGSKPGRVWEG